VATRRVLLLGATGLVGGECLRLLLEDPEIATVQVIARRAPEPASHPKLRVHVADFERLAEVASAFDVDAIICAIGTTIRKAGSRDRFRRVDHDYPLAAARIGREHGVDHYLLVSALGAASGSRVFYSRVKGEVEDGLRSLGYPCLTIVRPSLLLGHRAEFRLGESLAKLFAWAVPGRLRPAHARDVAATLVRECKRTDPGMRIIESEELRAGSRGQST
jgi:uncharacterized protein YbjT (DUF2867 family)